MFRKGILAIFTLLTFLGANDVQAYLNWYIYSGAGIKEQEKQELIALTLRKFVSDHDPGLDNNREVKK